MAFFGGDKVIQTTNNKSVEYDDEAKAAYDVIRKGVFSQFRGGAQVRAFEQEFASFVGTKYALSTTSGTTALHTAIAALNLPQNSEVLVPAVTFVSTASIVLQQGLKPIFVDINKNYCIDTDDMQKKITDRTKAVIPVHLFGHPADMDTIKDIANKKQIVVIEDACQSHGAEYKGKKTGNLGDLGCFSFYQTKNMTCGEGGMITFSNQDYYDTLRLLRENGSPYGTDTWYNYNCLGYNYNLTEIQAAIGRVQLRKLNENNLHRRKISHIYDTLLQGSEFVIPQVSTEIIHARHNYPILLPDRLVSQRDLFLKYLRAEGVPADIAYPCTLYQTELFSNSSYNRDCPYAEYITKRIVTLFTDNAISEEIARLTTVALNKVLYWMDRL